MGLLDKMNKKKIEPAKKAESTKKVSDTTVVKTEVQVSEKSQAYRVLIQPRVSEKALMGEAQGVYIFQVANNATKVDVKNAIREVYGVTPSSVRMINMDGKKVRFGYRVGRRDDWKKAIITLPKGQAISIHEGV